MQPFDTQAAALAEIVKRVRAFFAGTHSGGWREWLGTTLRPRWHSILLGPTGTGKTTLVGLAAESAAKLIGANCPATNINLVRVSAPAWMPAGAHQRAVTETIGMLAEQISRNTRTLLVVDELDKLYSTDNQWVSYIRGELFDLLDGNWPVGLKHPPAGDDDPDSEPDPRWLDNLTTKLRTSVYIMGIGTFQSWYDAAPSRRHMGFGADDIPDEAISADVIAGLLPRELTNRFGSIIRLPELKPADYQNIARQAEATLPERLRMAFREATERRIQAAISAKKGIRFLEEVVMDVITNLPPEPATAPQSILTPEQIDQCIL